MKMIMLAATAAMFAALATGVTPAKAGANEAYCLDGSGTTGQDRLCNFYTLAQCRASASGLAGTCIANPYLNNANASYRGRDYRH